MTRFGFLLSVFFVLFFSTGNAYADFAPYYECDYEPAMSSSASYCTGGGRTGVYPGSQPVISYNGQAGYAYCAPGGLDHCSQSFCPTGTVLKGALGAYLCSGTDPNAGSGGSGTGSVPGCGAGVGDATQTGIVTAWSRSATDASGASPTLAGNWASPSSTTTFARNGCQEKADNTGGCNITSFPSSTGYYAVTCTAHMVKTGLAIQTTDINVEDLSQSFPKAPNPVPANSPDNVVPNVASPSGVCPAGTVLGVDYGGEQACLGVTTPSGIPAGPGTPAPGATPLSTYDPGTGITQTVSTNTWVNPDGSTTVRTTTTIKFPDGSTSIIPHDVTGLAPNGAPGQNNLPAGPVGTAPGKDGVPSVVPGAGTCGGTGQPACSTATCGGTGQPSCTTPDLCTTNPSLTICTNSTVSNNCANGVATVSCTGDAIECAIAQSTADADCRDLQNIADIKASSQYGLGTQIMAGTDPMQSSLPTPENASAVSMPSLDASGWFGGGSCFPDKTFVVGGHTMTISFTAACGSLVAFRYAVMVVALLASFRMLSGVILRD